MLIALLFYNILFASQIILMKPQDFVQQTTVIDSIGDYVSEKVGLIVVDTITGLYREKLGDDDKSTFTLNRELNRQMACLAQITKTQRLACLIVSQVRSVVIEAQELVQPVAKRVLKFWADAIITLKPTAKPQVINATVELRKIAKPTKAIFLKIEERGLQDCKG